MEQGDSKPNFKINDFDVPKRLKPDLRYERINDIANEIIDLFQKNNLSYEEAEMVLRVTQVFIRRCKVVF